MHRSRCCILPGETHNKSMVASLHLHLHVRRLIYRNAHLKLYSTLTKPQLKALVLNHYSPMASLPTSSLRSPSSSSHAKTFLPLYRFSIQAKSWELRENLFDVAACCLTLTPTLVFPSLKLKVVIEAIQMVLEIVYDDRFDRHLFLRWLCRNETTHCHRIDCY